LKARAKVLSKRMKHYKAKSDERQVCSAKT
jgi:hypothetical protein